jgi:hypothetical protein
MLKDTDRNDKQPENPMSELVLPAVSKEESDPTRHRIEFGNFVPAFDEDASKFNENPSKGDKGAGRVQEADTTEQATLPRVILYLVTLFPLGQVVTTLGALDALETEGIQPAVLLGRHEMGDWGDVEKADWKANDDAVKTGGRLLSAYTLPQTQTNIWIITESDRSATTLLLPNEY